MRKWSVITIILALFASQAGAQIRPISPPDSYEHTMRDLGRPKYRPDGVGERSIRQDNEALRNRLLLPHRHQPLGGIRSNKSEM